MRRCRRCNSQHPPANPDQTRHQHHAHRTAPAPPTGIGCSSRDHSTSIIDLTEDEWRRVGEALGTLDRSLSWWLGDWWAFGERRYGERKALVEADDWDGPAYQTCADAAWVANKFEFSRRRENLTFKHHAEVAALPPAEADALLDWGEEPLARTGKPRPTRELRGEIANHFPSSTNNPVFCAL